MKMLNLTLAILIISASMMFTSCMASFGCIDGSGNIKTEDRSVGEFDKVVLSGNADIYIEQGTTQSVKVETDDNLMQYVTTRINGKTLIVETKENICTKKLNIHIVATKFEGAKIKGSGNIIGKGTLKTDKAAFIIDGSGDVVLAIEADAIKTEINGSGDIKIEGSVRFSESEIKGSGDLKLSGLKTAKTEIKIFGSGDASIDVSSELSVEIFGSGDVVYTGNPSKVDQNVFGSGSVHKK